MSTADVETKTAHFRVNGADFTRLVRDFMLSERPSAAWRLIAKGLRDEEGQGGAERYATGILDGKLKLVGNEKSLRILKDVTKSAKGYIKTLQYIYAGRIRLGPQRAWYRPYAEVVEFGPDDAAYASQRTRLGLRSPLVNPEDFPEGDVTTHADLRHWAAERVHFYGREGDRVVAVRKRRQKTVLDPLYVRLLIFEPVGELPHWWKEHTRPEQALEEFLGVERRLHVERWSDRFHPRASRDDEDDERDDGENVAGDVGGAFARGVVDSLAALSTRQEREREQEERFTKEDAARHARCEEIRAAVLAQAAGDMMDLHLRDGTKVATVPRAPFVRWALSRTSLRHLAPPWNTVSPSGMKLAMDEPDHTDWFFGATIHVTKELSETEKELQAAWSAHDRRYDYDYSSPLNDAAHNEMFELQEKLGEFEAAVIVDAGDVFGTVGREIVVLPDLQPDHVERMKDAKAILTETGGRVAHIAQIALEGNITIMRVSDACARYPEGTSVTLLPGEGKVRVHPDRW